MSNEPKVLPPRRFRSAGVVESVKFSPVPPPFINKQKRYGRRAEGIRYENKAHEYFQDYFGAYYVPSPWFTFLEVGAMRERWCQPDALLIRPDMGQITIIEYKLQHTSDAWWQLKWLYLPVIARAFPPNLWNYGMVEVVKWFDPATAFPEKVKMKASLFDVAPGEFGVHIWKP